MMRLNFLMLLAVVFSAMLLVHTEYQTRSLFMQIEAARKEKARLEVEHERLQLERRSQATPLRVEQIARLQLQMRMTNPAITQYVPLPGTPAAAAAAASAASAQEGKP